MKRILLFFMGLLVCVSETPASAVTINKAAPVAAQESSSSTTVNSLLPTVLGLISNVQQLSAKQKELTAECIPSTQEINFVDNIVKEWAKTGVMTADEVQKRLGIKRCETASGGYRTAVELYNSTEMEEMICYDYFASDGDKGMPWEKFPKVGKATYCSDGSPGGLCSDKDKVTVSNIYDIFNLIDFTDADYSPSELKMAGTLMSKIEQCSYSRLNAKKREMWGEFLKDTINSIGEPTNTGSIMEVVSGITNSSGLGGSVGTIGAFATSLFSK